MSISELNIDINKVKAEICRRSFFEFVKEFWDVIIPEIPIYNWHIPYLCDQLQKYALRVKYRTEKESDLIINIPPGTTKSTICTVMYPAWVWTIDATQRIITGSYSASLATDHALKSRDIVKSEKYKALFPEVVIKRDQDNKTHYKNTKGGERYATSVGGTITGIHAHQIIIDDPLNPKEAASDIERQAANDWMDVTLSTRKVDKEMTPTILVMQRLHELDCTGNWLKKRPNINHICLPGRLSKDVKPIELKEKYVDGKLDVKRLSDKALDELQTILGSYGFAGQIQQIPAPEDGGYWKKWIIPIPDKDFPTNLKEYGTDWDLAYTDNEKNSASAYVTSGKIEHDMYIDDFGFKWLEFPDLIKWMKTISEPHHIEAKASGKSAKQTLKSMGITAIEVKVNGGDKVARTQMSTPYAEAGRVYCRESLLDKLYNDSKQGILLFPNAEGNDLNDALCQAIQRLLSKKRGSWGKSSTQ